MLIVERIVYIVTILNILFINNVTLLEAHVTFKWCRCSYNNPSKFDFTTHALCRKKKTIVDFMILLLTRQLIRLKHESFYIILSNKQKEYMSRAKYRSLPEMIVNKSLLTLSYRYARVRYQYCTNNSCLCI